MEKSALYINYLLGLEEAIEVDNFDEIDLILETIYTSQIPDEDLIEIDNILQEATLYSEFKEADYKNEALKLIGEFK